MKVYSVSAYDIMYRLPRGKLEMIARDHGIKDPHLSSKPDLMERLYAACEFHLQVRPKEKVKT